MSEAVLRTEKMKSGKVLLLALIMIRNGPIGALLGLL
jgi:hypothetical protein